MFKLNKNENYLSERYIQEDNDLDWVSTQPELSFKPETYDVINYKKPIIENHRFDDEVSYSKPSEFVFNLDETASNADFTAYGVDESTELIVNNEIVNGGFLTTETVNVSKLIEAFNMTDEENYSSYTLKKLFDYESYSNDYQGIRTSRLQSKSSKESVYTLSTKDGSNLNVGNLTTNPSFQGTNYPTDEFKIFSSNDGIEWKEEYHLDKPKSITYIHELNFQAPYVKLILFGKSQDSYSRLPVDKTEGQFFWDITADVTVKKWSVVNSDEMVWDIRTSNEVYKLDSKFYNKDVEREVTSYQTTSKFQTSKLISDLEQTEVIFKKDSTEFKKVMVDVERKIIDDVEYSIILPTESLGFTPNQIIDLNDLPEMRMQAGTDGFTYSRPSSILVEPEFVEYDVSNNIILLKYHHTNIKGRELFFEIIARDSFINLSSNKLNLWKEGYLREKCEYRDIVETFGIETKPFTQLTFEKIYEFPKTRTDYNQEVSIVTDIINILEGTTKDRLVTDKYIISDVQDMILSSDDNITFKEGTGYRLNDNINGRFTEIHNGYEFVYAIDFDGRLWVGGRNDKGQLGLGHTKDMKMTPTDIEGIKEIMLPNFASSAVVLLQNGTYLAAGSNSNKNLGFTDTNIVTTFRELPFKEYEIHSLHMSGYGMVRVDLDGSIWVTGKQNYAYGDGFLLWEDGTTELAGWQKTLYNATDVNPDVKDYTLPKNVKQACMSEDSTILVTNDNKLYGVGLNNNYELGLDDNEFRSIFEEIAVPFTEEIKDIQNAYHGFVILTVDGNVWAVGYNQSGCFGLKTTATQRTLIQISDLTDVEKIVSSGRGTIIATKKDGSIWGSGYNGYYELGFASSKQVEEFIELGHVDTSVNPEAEINDKFYMPRDVKVMGAGHQSAVIQRLDGTISVTGNNEDSRLGIHEEDSDTMKGHYTAKSTGLWEDLPSLPNVFKIEQISEIENQTETHYNYFGTSIVKIENHLLVGAYNSNSGAGEVKIYKIENDNYVYQYSLTHTNGDSFGWSMSFDNNKLVVGATEHNSNRGYIVIYDFNGFDKIEENVFVENTVLTGHASNVRFGSSIKIKDDKLFIGIDADDRYGLNNGSVEEYNFDGTTWNLVNTIEMTNNGYDGYYFYLGCSLDYDGTTLFVGTKDKSAKYSTNGKVLTFEYNGLEWNHIDTIQAPNKSYRFGNSLVKDGNMLFIGANEENSSVGSVYLYELVSGEWKYTRRIFNHRKDNNGQRFGSSIFVENNRLYVGATYFDSDYTNSGKVFVYNIEQKTTTNTFDIKTIKCVERATFLLTTDGYVFETGYRSSMSNGYDVCGFTAVDLENVVKLDASKESAVAMVEDGNIYVWGSNRYGQLGLNFYSSNERLTKSGHINKVLAPTATISEEYIETGTFKKVFTFEEENSSIFIKTDDTIWASGENSYGQLALGHTDQVNVMEQIANISYSDVKDLVCTRKTLYILMNDGTLKGSGYNGNYQLGIEGDSTNRTELVDILTNVHSIAAGASSIYATLNDGVIMFAGYSYGSECHTDRTVQSWEDTGHRNITVNPNNRAALDKESMLPLNITDSTSRYASAELFIRTNDGKMHKSTDGQNYTEVTNGEFFDTFSNGFKDYSGNTTAKGTTYAVIDDQDNLWVKGNNYGGAIGKTTYQTIDNGDGTTREEIISTPWTNTLKKVKSDYFNDGYKIMFIDQSSNLIATGSTLSRSWWYYYSNTGYEVVHTGTFGSAVAEGTANHSYFAETFQTIASGVKTFKCDGYQTLLITNSGQLQYTGGRYYIHSYAYKYWYIPLGTSVSTALYNRGIVGKFGSTDNITSFTNIDGVNNAKDIVYFDNDRSIVTTNDGKILFTGKNDYYVAERLEETEIYKEMNISDVDKAYSDGEFTAAVKYDGTLWTVGRNHYGQLGFEHTEMVTDFTKVELPSTVKDVIVKSSTMVVLLDNGDVYSAGYSAHGLGGLPQNHGVNYLRKVIFGIDNMKIVHKQVYFHRTDGVTFTTGAFHDSYHVTNQILTGAKNITNLQKAGTHSYFEVAKDIVIEAGADHNKWNMKNIAGDCKSDFKLDNDESITKVVSDNADQIITLLTNKGNVFSRSDYNDYRNGRNTNIIPHNKFGKINLPTAVDIDCVNDNVAILTNESHTYVATPTTPLSLPFKDGSYIGLEKNNWTMEISFKTPEVANHQMIYSTHLAGSGYGMYVLHGSDDTLKVSLNGRNYVIATLEALTVYDLRIVAGISNSYNFYLNNKKVYSVNVDTNVNNFATNVVVGGSEQTNTHNYTFTGEIYFVRLTNDVLYFNESDVAKGTKEVKNPLFVLPYGAGGATYIPKVKSRVNNNEQHQYEMMRIRFDNGVMNEFVTDLYRTEWKSGNVREFENNGIFQRNGIVEISDTTTADFHTIIQNGFSIITKITPEPTNTNEYQFPLWKDRSFCISCATKTDAHSEKNKFAFSIYGTDNNWYKVSSDDEYENGREYTVAVVYDSTTNTMKLFIDGVLEKSAVIPASIATSNYKLNIGGSNRFIGKVSDVMMIGSVLSDIEIISHMNNLETVEGADKPSVTSDIISTETVNPLYMTGYTYEGESTTGEMTYYFSKGIEKVQSDILSYGLLNRTTLVIDKDNIYTSYGSNQYGQMGTKNTALTYLLDGSQIKRLLVKDVIMANNVIAFIDENDELWVAGYNGYSKFGQVETNNKYSLEKLSDAGKVSRVWMNAYTTVIEKIGEEKLYFCGSNYNNHIGYTSNVSTNDWTENPNLVASEIKDVVIEDDYTTGAIIKNDNSIFVAGKNDYGETGLGNFNSKTNGFVDTGFKGEISFGHIYSLIRNEENNWLYGTGSISYGVFGIYEPHYLTGAVYNTYENTRKYQVKGYYPSYSRSTYIVVSKDDEIIGKENDHLLVIGAHNYGANGRNQQERYFQPILDNENIDVKRINGSAVVTGILMNDGRLYTSGHNSYSRLGYTDADKINNRFKLVREDVEQFNCLETALIIQQKESNNIYSIGRNNYGQLGDDTFIDKSEFVDSEISGRLSLGQGFNRSYVISGTDEQLYVTGYNQDARLGFRDKMNRNSYTCSKEINIDHVVALETTSIYVSKNSKIWAAGNNYNGTLGIGKTNGYYQYNLAETNISRTDFEEIRSSSDYGHMKVFKLIDGWYAAGAIDINSYSSIFEIDEKYNGHDDNTVYKFVESDNMVDVLSSRGNDLMYLDNDGKVWYCGPNNYGQLGQNHTTKSDQGWHFLTDDARAIQLGDCMVYILKNNGLIYTSGYDSNKLSLLRDTTPTTKKLLMPLQYSDDDKKVYDISEFNLKSAPTNAYIGEFTDLTYTVAMDNTADINNGYKKTYKDAEEIIISSTTDETSKITMKHRKVEEKTNSLAVKLENKVNEYFVEKLVTNVATDMTSGMKFEVEANTEQEAFKIITTGVEMNELTVNGVSVPGIVVGTNVVEFSMNPVSGNKLTIECDFDLERIEVITPYEFNTKSEIVKSTEYVVSTCGFEETALNAAEGIDFTDAGLININDEFTTYDVENQETNKTYFSFAELGIEANSGLWKFGFELLDGVASYAKVGAAGKHLNGQNQDYSVGDKFIMEIDTNENKLYLYRIDAYKNIFYHSSEGDFREPHNIGLSGGITITSTNNSQPLTWKRIIID